MLLNQTIKNLRRVREILAILVKYGFDDVISQAGLDKLVSERLHLEWNRKDRPAFEYSTYERLRLACEELGPTFIKFAQVLSSRPDLLPGKLIKELEKLQSHVSPFPTQDAVNIIEAETGEKIYKLFRDFSDEPIGAASIGQVHRAVMRDGEQVVIKVRRPTIKATVATDIAIIKDLMQRAEGFLEKRFGVIHAMDAVTAFEKSIQKELDYRTEARHIQQFRNQYRNSSKFYVPKVYSNYCSERVLVMEYVEGVPINNIAQLKEWGLKPERIAEKGLDVYLTQIFENGYFHADPHPGNVLVRKDGTICLIDYGMMGKITKKDKFAFAGLLTSMAQEDPRRMALNFKRLAIEDQIEDLRMFEYELNELIEDFAFLSVEESNISELILRLQKIIYDYRIRIPSSVFLIMRALAIIDGIGKKLHPKFQANEFIVPYGIKLFAEQYSEANIRNELLYRGSQFISLFNNIPVEVKQILRKTRKGELSIRMEHHGYDDGIDRIERIINKVSLAVVTSAVVIASAITTTTSWPGMSRVYGIPYISFLGFAIAAGLFLLLVYNMLGRGNTK